jgi:hypothetical protein
MEFVAIAHRMRPQSRAIARAKPFHIDQSMTGIRPLPMWMEQPLHAFISLTVPIRHAQGFCEASATKDDQIARESALEREVAVMRQYGA